MLHVQFRDDVLYSIAVHRPSRRHGVMSVKTRTTIEDLYKVAGKAEIVNGEIVLRLLTGGIIYTSLLQYERLQGHRYAFSDAVEFIANLPHRESFSPDAAWDIGALQGSDFLDGAPIFAVKSGVKTIADLRQKMPSRRNALIISPVTHSWDGRSMCSVSM